MRDYIEIPEPEIELVVKETGWSPWRNTFHRWHYLSDAGPMAYSTGYCGFVGDEPIAFMGMSGMVTGKGTREARGCRLVVLPEWMGAGVGIRFLEYLCDRELRGEGFIGTPTTTMFHSAHPALVVSLLRNPKWRAVSSKLYGAPKEGVTGMGGHLRAVAGFRYGGERYAKAMERSKAA